MGAAVRTIPEQAAGNLLALGAAAGPGPYQALRGHLALQYPAAWANATNTRQTTAEQPKQLAVMSVIGRSLSTFHGLETAWRSRLEICC
jgi:hypothetical protein